MLPGVKLSILTPAYHQSATWPSLERCFKPRPAALYQKATWRDGAEAPWILLRQRFAARRA
jgi:hypothetical protein